MAYEKWQLNEGNHGFYELSLTQSGLSLSFKFAQTNI